MRSQKRALTGRWAAAVVPAALAMGIGLGIGALAACGPALPGGTGDGVERTGLAELLGAGSEAGFARALEPRPFRFPEDHGPHPDFKAEWWYLTGHLEAEDGRRFGYQATIFRSALAPGARSPEPTVGDSAWRTSQLYMGHFALTDVDAGRFRWFERFSRGALGLAGARAAPFRVWLEDWEIGAPEGAASEGGAPEGGPPPFTLRFAEDDVALELELEAVKPMVLQGDRGLSQKGSQPGNASYYYAFTRLESRGTVAAGGPPVAVRGLSWMDREWSTSALESGVVGWDWFSLQLDDGRELMLYRLRREDGTPHPASSGSLVDRDGVPARLDADDATLEVLDRWRSPETGARYPSRWSIDLPAYGLELEVEPLLADQELGGTVVYWEGAVSARGSGPDGPLAGRGYVELTGYDRHSRD